MKLQALCFLHCNQEQLQQSCCVEQDVPGWVQLFKAELPHTASINVEVALIKGSGGSTNFPAGLKPLEKQRTASWNYPLTLRELSVHANMH